MTVTGPRYFLVAFRVGQVPYGYNKEILSFCKNLTARDILVATLVVIFFSFF